MKKFEFGQRCKTLVVDYEGVLTGRHVVITGCDLLGITNDKDETKWFNEPMVKVIDDELVDEFENSGCNKFGDLDNAKFEMGTKVRDKISEFEGKITSKVINITGDISYSITPKFDKKSKNNDAEWFDEGRLEMVEEKKGGKYYSEERKGGIAKPSGIGRIR